MVEKKSPKNGVSRRKTKSPRTEDYYNKERTHTTVVRSYDSRRSSSALLVVLVSLTAAGGSEQYRHRSTRQGAAGRPRSRQ